MMNDTSVMELKKDAYSLLERIPAEKLIFLVEIMRGMDGLEAPKKVTENSPAFRRLMELRRPIPDLDEEKELAEWREEKFGYANCKC